MVQPQIISKILQEKDISFVTKNNLIEEYFTEYPEEFRFLMEHFRKYGVVPDKETFSEKFPEFEILTVQETEKYLLVKLNEEVIYRKTLAIYKKTQEIFRVDSVDAMKYCANEISKVTSIYNEPYVDLRDKSPAYEEYVKMRDHKDMHLISTGFAELDEIIGGFRDNAELVTLVARTGQSKSWILLKMLLSCWQCGKAVALIEPEMDLVTTHFRWDALYKHFSNFSLAQGYKVDGYQEYCKEIKNVKNKFIYTNLKDFHNRCTISALRSFIKNNNLQMLGIDGISYLTDERQKYGDNKTTQLTHIAEDLMQLSQELHIPIIVVSQANRGATGTDSGPEIENIRDSDGLAFNSTIIISLKFKDKRLTMSVKKNRRGITGQELNYVCELDTGYFTYDEQVEEPAELTEHKSGRKKKAETPEDVF